MAILTMNTHNTSAPHQLHGIIYLQIMYISMYYYTVLLLDALFKLLLSN